MYITILKDEEDLINFSEIGSNAILRSFKQLFIKQQDTLLME